MSKSTVRERIVRLKAVNRKLLIFHIESESFARAHRIRNNFADGCSSVRMTIFEELKNAKVVKRKI